MTDIDVFTIILECLKWGIILGTTFGLIYAIIHR